MKLKIRYENEIQTIELDAKATEEMWVSLSLEGEGLSQAEREELIQKEWNEQFNKDDYNNWHKFNRHRGYSKAVPDEETDEVDCSEPLMSEVRDPRIFCRQELEKDKQYDYEACCDRIRALVKPAQADMLIAIMSKIAKEIYGRYPYDGKYILDEARLIICQSNVKSEELQQRYYYAQVNPLGDWTGGTDVDTGVTNRKLGSKI